MSLRADAARNRETVLETAYRSFAAEGLTVPIDEIARRAGVGAGTVYRHFPTKNALIAAVIGHRLAQIEAAGRDMLAKDSGHALTSFVRAIVLEWGAVDQAISQAIAGEGILIDASDFETRFMVLLAELLDAAKTAGSVRADLTDREAKAVIVACQAVQSHVPDVAERVTEIVLDGIRPQDELVRP